VLAVKVVVVVQVSNVIPETVSTHFLVLYRGIHAMSTMADVLLCRVSLNSNIYHFTCLLKQPIFTKSQMVVSITHLNNTLPFFPAATDEIFK
jgi:hypothetical protein